MSPATRRLPSLLFLLLLWGQLALFAAAGLAGCDRSPPAEPAKVATSATPSLGANRQPLAPSLTPAVAAVPSPPPAPPLPAAAGYVGSAVCADCHDKKHSAWTDDWHARALSKVVLDSDGKAPLVVGNFAGAHFAGESSEAWMRQDGGGYTMRTRDEQGRLGDFAVSWVVGGKRMQDSVTVLPDGRWQILPVYYHVTGGGAWVDYNESKQGRVDPSHPFFWTNFRRNAQHECLDCHTSGLRVDYDPASRRFATGFADAGVGCESCHGPGQRHADSQAAVDIVHPGKLARRDRRAALGICAQCHGPRQPLFPIHDAAHRYRAGQSYDELYSPLVIVSGSSRSGEYFADGRPKSSSFEYQALLQSRCYLRGQAICLDCHSAPHEPHGENELKLPSRRGPASGATVSVDEGCRRCHGGLFAAAARARHSRHQSAAGQSCVSCHMPKLVSGVLDQFADHALDVPLPENSLRHGVPSACGLCHPDRSPTELGAQLAKLWPGASRRQARRLRLADAIDEKTAASSQPALLAVVADDSEAPTLRAACAQLLAQRFPGAVAALLPLLRHPEPLLRARVAEALGQAKARPLAESLLPLLDDRTLLVRQTAALVLAMLNHPRGEPALQQLATAPETSGLMHPHYLLGLLLARRGDLGQATVELERAVALVPYFTDALVALSDVYGRRGRGAEARAQLLAAQRFDPQSQPVRERLSRLGLR